MVYMYHIKILYLEINTQFGLGFIDIQVPLFLPRHPGGDVPAVSPQG
jgi:hypothetical protein